jgi:hypothetical protein
MREDKKHAPDELAHEALLEAMRKGHRRLVAECDASGMSEEDVWDVVLERNRPSKRKRKSK